MYNKKAHLHFVGIGGIGMSGIAKILHYQGYTISGCDSEDDQHSIHELRNLGCTIYHGNNTAACHDASIDIVVYSSAIHNNNPEIKLAQARNIPTIPRAVMLAELMRTKYSIAIAGSHGKTTTTSLISHLLIEAAYDPTVIIGGHLKTISTNAQLGNGDFLVAEADESDKSLSYLQATIAVVTNISREHLDIYKDIDDIKTTFKQFLLNLPFYGTAIVCIDNPHVRALLPLPHIKTIKYGLDIHADIYAHSINLNPDYTTFAVHHHKYQELGVIKTRLLGLHNIQNCLAAIALALEVDIPLSTITESLESFKGIERRFSFRGLYREAEIFDDYGHHPEEIRNTLTVAQRRSKGHIIVIFQPHRYTRTDALWNEFIEMFSQASLDHLIITDIYPAGEAPIPFITAQRLFETLKDLNPPYTLSYVPYESHFQSLQAMLDTIVQPNDLVLLQGAGNINKFAAFLCPLYPVAGAVSLSL